MYYSLVIRTLCNSTFISTGQVWLHIYNQTGAYEKVIQLGTRLLDTDKDPEAEGDVLVKPLMVNR
jgi:hypothetical protein